MFVERCVQAITEHGVRTKRSGWAGGLHRLAHATATSNHGLAMRFILVEGKPAGTFVLSLDHNSDVRLFRGEAIHGVGDVSHDLGVVHFAARTYDSMSILMSRDGKPFATTFPAFVVDIVDPTRPGMLLH